jgi:photosystem II stability/assembly factor-like uncharacterized protein
MKNYFTSILLLSMFLTSHLYAQWVVVSVGNTKDLNSISFPTFNTGYAVGDSGYVRKSTNVGGGWFDITINTTKNLKKVQGFSTNLAYICGDQGAILKTTNNGVNWIAINPDSSFNYNDMDFIDNNTGIVVGQHRRFSYTPDGGTNWVSGVLNTIGLNNLDAFSVEMINGSTIYIGTSDTLISGNYTAYVYKSTNSGVSFTLSTSTTHSTRSGFIDIQFLDANTGYALSQNNFVYRTTNAGANWSLGNVLFPVRSMYFANSLTGYTCGVGGQIRKTTNGGVNWLQQNSPTTLTMNSTYFIDAVTGFAAGLNGFMVKTGNGGTYTAINQIGNEIPKDYSLSQNYPNPFNPSTNISFDIPKASFVKLTLYNILGTEVKVMTNEYLAAGRYSVNADASELPSGTYFYRITAGTFSDTKKMILVK